MPDRRFASYVTDPLYAQVDEETGVLLPQAPATRGAWGLSRSARPQLGIAGAACQSRRQSQEARAL